MKLNWFESMLYGLFSGLTDILPVSAQAHKTLMLKFFGINGDMELLDLLVNLAVAAALYINCRSQLVRMTRAKALARLPKTKRKRPLDVRSLMDLSMLKTMLIPVLLGLLLYRQATKLQSNLIFLAVFLMINGIILYVPQFFPGGNRDCRTLSRVEGLLMGLGGAVSAVPGISSMGAAISIGSVCGVERTYCLNMTLMMHLFLTAGYLVYDVMNILENGFGLLSVMIVLRYLITAAVAFGSTMLGIRMMRQFAENQGYAAFGFYCFGLSLFTFILNLMA